MKKRGITKTEKQGIFFLLISILVFAFLTDPITTFVSSTFKNPFTIFMVGLVLLIGVAWWGKLNKILR
jgi:hypothetical protein